MSLHQRLEARMAQSLVMTPRLQQAIKLLQYNHMEMVEHINEEMLNNPVLEEVPDTEYGAREEDFKADAIAREQQAELASQENRADGEGFDYEGFLDHMAAQNSTAPRESAGLSTEELPPIETNHTVSASLAEHLLDELAMVRCGDNEHAAAEVIIYNLDDDGYLQISLEEVAAAAEVSLEDAHDGQDLVQQLDPLGCGSRNLAECLICQVRALFPDDPYFAPILENHLSDLERRNYAGIAKALALDLEDVIEYHKMIQNLEPRPGRQYSSSAPRYITPDVYVVRVGDEWQVLINDEGLPDLRVSAQFKGMLRKADKETRAYIKDNIAGARALIESIQKRRQTIRRVTEEIIKFQHEFFEHGADALRPLVLQDVADEVINPKTGKPLHMSTVSRVTSNKYVHTPHGIFELKYFFSAAVPQQTGSDMAAEAIKSRIKSMIDAENPKKPLSDQAIANALKEDGVDVARRTVAKYREALKILPSSNRKQMF